VTYKLMLGVLVAAAAWAAMFVPDRKGFWPRAAAAAAAVAGYAVLVEPTAIGHRFAHGHWGLDLLVGFAAGLALYVVFWIGEQLLVIVLPALAAEVSDLYQVKRATRPWVIPPLVVLAAASEEVFFRGLVWERGGVVAGLAVYGVVHLWERKWVLVLAAVVAGAWWGGLLSLTGSLAAAVASHVTWGLLIIVMRPVGPSDWALRTSLRFHPLAVAPGLPAGPSRPAPGDEGSAGRGEGPER
jgi:membrane protease YdiL (CAAX protease family)